MSYTYCFTVLLLQAMIPSPNPNIEKSWSNKLGDATWRHRPNSGLMKNYNYLRARSPLCWLKWWISMPFHSVYTCTLYYMLNEFPPILYKYILADFFLPLWQWKVAVDRDPLQRDIKNHSGSHCWRGNWHHCRIGKTNNRKLHQAPICTLDPKRLRIRLYVLRKGFPRTNPRSGDGIFQPSILLQDRGETRHGTLTLNDVLPKESPFQGLPLSSKIWVFSGHVQVLSGPWGGFFGILVFCSWF